MFKIDFLSPQPMSQSLDNLMAFLFETPFEFLAWCGVSFESCFENWGVPTRFGLADSKRCGIFIGIAIESDGLIGMTLTVSIHQLASEERLSSPLGALGLFSSKSRWAVVGIEQGSRRVS